MKPAVTLKMQENSSLAVSGTLIAKGTADYPISITSYNDDLRNDTNGEGLQPNHKLEIGLELFTIQAPFITLGTAQTIFRNGEILHSAGDGILVLDQASPTFGDLRFTDTVEWISTSNRIVSNCTDCYLRVAALSSIPLSFPYLSLLTCHNPSSVGNMQQSRRHRGTK